MSACAHMLGADVALKVAGICEHLEFEKNVYKNTIYVTINKAKIFIYFPPFVLHFNIAN